MLNDFSANNVTGAGSNLASSMFLEPAKSKPFVGPENLDFAPPAFANMGDSFKPVKFSRAEDVYSKVLRPYDYREGFHYLLKYVKERMEKKDIMRICRALAQFRPSFMALIMNLSEEDLIFMEKCFQRTLMEFEKLISYSGTPTVVWRRTGEIALVGKEFSLLTQWPKERLLERKTYIYELMDTNTAVEYWEKFATMSFDNSQQSWMVSAVLISPTSRPVPCSCCFTIKRDIFDVPLAIVGNFLPLFQAR
ncbi:Transcriptional regulator of nonfermentable carbon utilization [Blyttiomyces sp. JEL0837]|nr:Transcriptional regulator of nonfermentable carbon utilization [Blyttiomyces sp. JEL0837]